MTLTVIADENIAALDKYFAPYARIIRKSGRTLQRSDVAGADALLVRSVSEVNAELLAGSNIQFVGSATIGTDHIDHEYLDGAGIEFANAPGSNAASVADYVCSALAALVPDLMSIRGSGLRAGVIGLGEVGSRVARRLQTFGYKVLAYDPFKSGGDGIELVSLDEALQTDVLSLHVPLTTSGEHPTYQMINAEQLRRLSGQAVLINTARGNVVHGEALGECLERSPGMHAILDVWEGEPAIDAALAQRVSIATPHIAGYAYDGKLRGTEMLANAFLSHFGLKQSQLDVDKNPHRVKLGDAANLNDVLLQAYNVRNDDSSLRHALAGHNIARDFDALRKNYPMRREYASTTLEFEQAPQAVLLCALRELGFKV